MEDLPIRLLLHCLCHLVLLVLVPGLHLSSIELLQFPLLDKPHQYRRKSSIWDEFWYGSYSYHV